MWVRHQRELGGDLAHLPFRCGLSLRSRRGALGEERWEQQASCGPSPARALAGWEGRKFKVKEGDLSGDGVAPSRETGNSCRAGWRQQDYQAWEAFKG